LHQKKPWWGGKHKWMVVETKPIGAPTALESGAREVYPLEMGPRNGKATPRIDATAKTGTGVPRTSGKRNKEHNELQNWFG